MGKYVSDNPIVASIKDLNGNEYLPEVYPVLSESMVVDRVTKTKLGSYDAGISEMICDDNYIYALSSWNRYYLRKYDINTLQMVAEIYTSTIWGSQQNLSGLTQDDTYVYVGSSSAGKNIARITKETLTLSAKNIDSGKAAQSLTMAGGKLYAAMGSTSVVSKYNPTTLALEGSIAGSQYAQKINSDENFIYFTYSYNNTTPYSLMKYDLNLAFVQSIATYGALPFLWVGDKFLSIGQNGILLWGKTTVGEFDKDASECKIDLFKSRNTTLKVAGRSVAFVPLKYPYVIIVIDGNTTGAFDKVLTLVNMEKGIQMPMDDFSVFNIASSGSFFFADLIITKDGSHAILALFNAMSSGSYVHSFIKIKVSYKENTIVKI